MEHLKLLKEYESELQMLKSKDSKDESILQRIENLESKIGSLHKMIDKKENSFLIQTKSGFLTRNGQFTDNMEFAYVFDSEEAIRKARSIKGWLVERK